MIVWLNKVIYSALINSVINDAPVKVLLRKRRNPRQTRTIEKVTFLKGTPTQHCPFHQLLIQQLLILNHRIEQYSATKS